MAKKKKAGVPHSEVDPQLKNVAKVVAMGKLFADGDLKKENEWAVRMMKAGLGHLGLSIPDDWDSLSEEEKARRIEGVMKVLKED